MIGLPRAVPQQNDISICGKYTVGSIIVGEAWKKMFFFMNYIVEKEQFFVWFVYVQNGQIMG